jgi:hypothetical protein
MIRVIIDIETLKDFFCLTALDYSSNNYVKFEISSRKNDFKEMKIFLNTIEYFIGFNSLSFDETVLLYITKNNIDKAEDIYLIAQDVIENGDNYEANQKYRSLKFNKVWKSIDLFLYWSKQLRLSKKLSLKYFAVNLNMNVQEMPIHHTKENLTAEEMDLVLDYNLNDCQVTKALAKELKEQIALRISIQKEYGLDAISWDAPKIASELLLDSYCKETYKGEPLFWQYKKEVKMSRFEFKHFRNGNYLPRIEFKTEIFINLYRDICNSFSGFTRDIIFKRFDGSFIKISYGSGGIHTVHKNENYESTLELDIYTSDVSSLYPTLLENYKFIRPELNQVLEIYSKKKQDRIKAKKEGNKTVNETLKLVLNSTTGLLDNEHSWLYSPSQIMGLRLTGQLILSRLLEECDLNKLLVISQNTDGQEVIVPKDREFDYLNIIKLIEKEFNLEFEHDKYKFIKYQTVNDYIALTEKGKIKVKGEYIYEKVLDGSNEFLIVPIALKNYFVDGTPIRETILNHKNIFDFCAAKKVSKDYSLTHNGKKVQQLNRFYCSKKGAYLYKQKRGKNTLEHVFKESGVQILNNPIVEFPEDIDYNFYINKTQEKINLFQKKQLTLF